MKRHADLPRALAVLDARARSAGMHEGLNPGDGYAVLLTGTDLRLRELTAIGARMAAHVVADLAALPEDGPEDSRDVIALLAGFWRFAAVAGALAQAEAGR